MSFCETCGHRYSTMCSSCATLNGVPVKYEKKKRTNADSIRAMSDEELADEILKWFNWLNAVEWDDKRIIEWLKQETD